MSKPDLTEVLYQYAESCGLDPSNDKVLHQQLKDMADECTDTVEIIAYRKQNNSEDTYPRNNNKGPFAPF